MSLPLRIFKFNSLGVAKECFYDILQQAQSIGVELNEKHVVILIFEDCVMIDHVIQICKQHGGYDAVISEVKKLS